VEAVREVPRRQDRYDTERLTTKHRCAGADSGDRLVGQLRGELGRVHGHVPGAVDLHHAFIRDAAPLDLREREEIVRILAQRVAKLIEVAGAVFGARSGPRSLVERPARGRDRLADLRDTRVRRGRDGLLGGRVDVVVTTVLRLDPSPADIEL